MDKICYIFWLYEDEFIEINDLCYNNNQEVMAMEYLKKNKVFIFLVGVLAISIITLALQLMNEDNDEDIYQPDPSKQSEKENTEIQDFKVELGSTLDLTFSWDIKRGSEVIEKVEIFHGDTLLQDVTNKAIYSMPLFHSGIHTGNNEFTFKVHLDTGNLLEKSQYLYIDEVQAFNMTKIMENNKIQYILTYYYDKEHEVGTPQIHIVHNRNDIMPIEFVSKNTLGEENGFEKVEVIYEINLSLLMEDSYQLNLTFSFEEYNLIFNETDIIEL